MLKLCPFNPNPGSSRGGYIYLSLQIFVIKSEPQYIFLKTFWLLIFINN